MKKAVMSIDSNKINFFKFEKADWEAMQLSYSHWDSHWNNKIKWAEPFWISEFVDPNFAFNLKQNQSILQDANFSQIHLFLWHFRFEYKDIIFKPKDDFTYRGDLIKSKMEYFYTYNGITKHFFVLK
jgi:hypothetical protein